ncbi:MAG: DUF4870 domain-containing protein [Anaerolineae bacterium]
MAEQRENPFDLGPDAASTEPSSDDKLWCGLSYFSQFVVPVVLPLILLLGEQTKEKEFIRHHAITSLGLLAAAVVYEIAAAIIYSLIMLILPLLACILWLIFVVPIVPLVYYGIKALKGEYVEVPYLTEFLRKQGWL